MRQPACIVFNPITVYNFAILFDCTPVGRASDLMIIAYLFTFNDGPDIKLFILVGRCRSFCVCCLAHRGSTVGFLLLQCSRGVVRHPKDKGVGRNTLFLSSPHLCFIIVFICDLFVSRDDPLMS